MQIKQNTHKDKRNDRLVTVGIWTVVFFFIIVLPLIMLGNSNKQREQRRLENAAKVAQDKQACEDKAPYFKWVERPVNSVCERVKYESRQACIDDGKNGVHRVNLPADEGGGSEVYGVRCLDDGTWETYDPEYEDYKEQQYIQKQYP